MDLTKMNLRGIFGLTAVVSLLFQVVLAGELCFSFEQQGQCVPGVEGKEKAALQISVEDGKIIERGRHEDLLKLHGYYYELYTRQYEDEATSAFLG